MLTINLEDIKIKPIANDADFKEISSLIDELVDADLIENSEERQKAMDMLEVLTVLAIEYEKKHYPIPKLSSIEAIKQRMEMLNLSQKEVAKYFGGENRVSEVLNGKRQLTLKMIKNLYHNMGIPAEVLLAI
ncbi:MAG: helix-turn-helix domain-containing protein [Arcicella sp.]|nr:helix-turn-helix domain-containing protein [Arcicella sp.]